VTVAWQCWLSGRLRGTDQPLNAMFDAEFSMTGAGVVERAAVTIDQEQLARLREARLRS
jgi:hypothetical protein